MSSDAEAEDNYAYKKLETEFKEFLTRAMAELTELNREIEYLQPKARAYDHMITLTSVISDLRGGNRMVGGRENLALDIKRRLEKF